MPWGFTWGDTSFNYEAEGREEPVARAYCGFHKKVLARQDKQAYGWLV